MNKVDIGYCHYGTVHAPFMESMLQLVMADMQGPNVINEVIGQQGAYIPLNRNCIVQRFLKGPAQVLVFMDYDIIFTPEQFYKLLELSVDYPIIAGQYLTFLEDGIQPCWKAVDKDQKGDLVDLNSCGMGFTAIHRSVLEKMEESFHLDPWKWFGHDVAILKSGDRGRAGEDITFSHRAYRLGYNIKGYTGFKLGHIKSMTL